MNITEVRVKLLEGRSDRLRAFCSVTIDGEFVVHDLRVIDGRKGLFVAMPSRKLSDNCPRCGGKNHLRAKFCSDCGAKLDENRALGGPHTREKLHVDVAHPINPACREKIQNTALLAYQEEVRRVASGLAPAHPYECEDVGGDYEAEYPEGDAQGPAEEVAEYGEGLAEEVAEHGEEPAEEVAEYGEERAEEVAEYGEEPTEEVAEYGEESAEPEVVGVREQEEDYEARPSEQPEEQEPEPAPPQEPHPEQVEEETGGFGDGIL